MFQHFITSHFINLILTDSLYMTALMVNGLVLLLNLFVHYFSNESSESLSRLENHPKSLHLQRMTKFLSFAVIVFQDLPQLMCAHFAGTNQNGRNKQGSRKKLLGNSITCGGFQLQFARPILFIVTRSVCVYSSAQRSALADALGPMRKVIRCFFFLLKLKNFRVAL